jgi:hypothetical protein
MGCPIEKMFLETEINYKAFQKAEAKQAYLNELSANVPTKSWSKNATLAYWINAYNAYTVLI